MDNVLKKALDQPIPWDVFLALAASSLVWAAIVRRVQHRRPVVRYEERCPVPWTGVHVIAILALYFLLPVLLGLAGNLLLGVERDPHAARVPAAGVNQGQPLDKQDIKQDAAAGHEETSGKEAGHEKADREEADRKTTDLDHPTIDLLRQDGSALTWLLCIVTVVLIAPVAEEFLFRLLLQGWLEAAESRYRRRVGRYWLRLAGTGPVLAASILFAAMHYRTAVEPIEPDLLRKMLLAQGILNLIMVAYGIGLLRLCTGATAVDLGFVREKFFADVGLGLAAFLAVALPIYLLQALLTWLLPGVVPDPITLFFFAVALGFLYCRTHRIVPAIVLHMTLNAVSLTMAWILLN